MVFIIWHAFYVYYLVILPISLSDQNVQLRIKILRKIMVAQLNLKGRCKEWVQNSALDTISEGRVFSFMVGILIFMHNI